MKPGHLLALVAVPGTLASSSAQKRQFDQPPEPQWSEIEPTTVEEGLSWVPCYRTEGPDSGNIECARLIVPMDYDAKNGSCSDSGSVTLALFRIPSRRRGGKKGSVLTNPGGPGLSGLPLLLWNGWVQDEIAPDFDLVSWDPRGMYRSVPRQECWASHQRRVLYASRYPGPGNEYEDPAYLNSLRRYWSTESAACESFMSQHANNIQRYVSTYHHAHDMLSIMKALGETTVNYWGTSWGTVLGNYFATLFPERVGRMVLESNVDIQQWRSAKGLFSEDTEAILQKFFEECAKSTACDIHEPTPEAVEQRYNRIMNTARLNMTRDINYSFDWVLPYASPFATVLTDSINFGYIGKTYAWILSWSLSDIEVEATSPRDIPEAEADPAGLASSSLRGILDDRPTDPLDPDRGFDFMRIAEDYTRCNDFAQLPDDIDALIADYEEARNRSRFPSLELQYVWDCVGKTAVPRFNGTFGGQTRHPILYSNNELDIATPLVSARRNAEIFPGSEVLVLEGIGHGGSLSNQCALEYYRKYFEDGTLPPPDTICPENPGPWFPEDEESGLEKRTRAERSRELRPEIREAIRRIQAGIFL